MGQTQVSEDGRLLAYARQEAGSDWSTIRVIEVESGRELPDELKWARHGNIVWNAAGDGFFYARYPEPPEGEQFQALSLNQMIYFHRLGDPQSKDRLVFRQPDNPKWSFWLTPHRRQPVPGADRSPAAPIRRTRCSCAASTPRTTHRGPRSSATSTTSSASSATSARGCFS